MSSRLRHQPVEPLGLLVDRLRPARGAPRLQGGRLDSRRARGAGDGGQRRAQVVRDRAQQRAAQPLALRREPRCARALGEPRALERPRRSGARAPRAGRSWSGGSGQQRSARPRRPARRGTRSPATQRHVERRAAGQRVGAEPGGAAVVERPLRHRALARVAREAGRVRRRRLEPRRPGPAGAPRPGRAAASSTWRAPAAAIVAPVVRGRPARGSARRASCVRCSRCGRPRPASRTRAASVLISRPTTSITAKVTRYCVSRDGEGQVGRHEEEVERGHARARRRAPTARARSAWRRRPRRAGRP